MAAEDYRLDVYDPQGNFLTRTTGVAAARMTVDTFRNVYTLNYESWPTRRASNPRSRSGIPRRPEDVRRRR
jgi:hypothetical protein